MSFGKSANSEWTNKHTIKTAVRIGHFYFHFVIIISKEIIFEIRNSVDTRLEIMVKLNLSENSRQFECQSSFWKALQSYKLRHNNSKSLQNCAFFGFILKKKNNLIALIFSIWSLSKRNCFILQFFLQLNGSYLIKSSFKAVIFQFLRPFQKSSSFWWAVILQFFINCKITGTSLTLSPVFL